MSFASVTVERRPLLEKKGAARVWTAPILLEFVIHVSLLD